MTKSPAGLSTRSGLFDEVGCGRAWLVSKTDNTTPYRFREQAGLVYDHYIRWVNCHHSGTKWMRKRDVRRARQAERLALLRREEPQPYRPRHNARWYLG